jgi:hypothetical protein
MQVATRAAPRNWETDHDERSHTDHQPQERQPDQGIEPAAAEAPLERVDTPRLAADDGARSDSIGTTRVPHRR